MDGTTTKLTNSPVTYEATPPVVESYPVPVEPTSDSWVDAVLAEIKGRRPRLLRRD